MSILERGAVCVREEKRNSVLIIDDSKQNIDVLRGILEDDYTVFVATGGAAGLNVMRRMLPDIVLLDVVMPEMDGFTVLKQMKTDTKTEKLPVIFLSAETGVEIEGKGLELGAFDYIAKPYAPEIIKLKVRNQIGNKLYRDELEATVFKQTQELLEVHNAVIMGMSLMAESHDQDTGDHLKRMQKYTEILAAELRRVDADRFSGEFVQNVVLYSPLHDVGKVSIPDAILHKPGKLTNEEFEIVKNHTISGAKVLSETKNFMPSSNDTLQIAINIAESHHEKFNGHGYPHGKAGEDIPIEARIVALADIYDALTSKRDYKPAFTHEEAVKIICEGDGRTMPEHFDPLVLNAFKATSEQFREMAEGQL